MSRLAVALALTLATLAASCTTDAPVDLSSSRAVTFPVLAPDDVTLQLEGRVFGGDGRLPGVVLAHMSTADQRSWFDFASTLADEGYRVLTFDFRGFCPGGDGGCSQGTRDPSAAGIDLAAAIAFLREQDVSSISIVGASMGGTAGIVTSAALETTDPVAAVVTLSAPVRIDRLVIEPAMLQTQTAKLLVAGTGDATAAKEAQTLYAGATAPKRVEIVPSDEHGTGLLEGARGGEIERLILLWLDRYD